MIARTDPMNCLDLDETAKTKPCSPMPRNKLTIRRLLRSSEEIRRALHIGADRVQFRTRWFRIALAGLVSMCLVLAAIVWWQLLT